MKHNISLFSPLRWVMVLCCKMLLMAGLLAIFFMVVARGIMKLLYVAVDMTVALLLVAMKATSEQMYNGIRKEDAK